MPTKFSTIYDRAVFKFVDYSFLHEHSDFKEAVMQRYLLSAITDFQHVCKADLTQYDLQKGEFAEELDNEMIEILACGVAFYWLSARAMNRELLKNIIHNKDYTSYSPGNLLKEIQSLRSTIELEYRGRINEYSFRHSNLSEWK